MLKYCRWLDELRVNSNCWQVGLEIFTSSNNPTAIFFGLSLIREYLAKHSSTSEARLQIRTVVMQWLNSVVVLNTEQNPDRTSSFIVNNIISILTLLVKSDFPEKWPEAFSDILSYGVLNAKGLDIFTGVLVE